MRHTQCAGTGGHCCNGTGAHRGSYGMTGSNGGGGGGAFFGGGGPSGGGGGPSAGGGPGGAAMGGGAAFWPAAGFIWLTAARIWLKAAPTIWLTAESHPKQPPQAMAPAATERQKGLEQNARGGMTSQ